MNASPSCLFCDVVAGRQPAHVVLDHHHAVAFLDTAPLFKGHVLVVPRQHVQTLDRLPSGDVGPFFLQVQRVAACTPGALGASGSFVAMNNGVSQSVPHLHVHVVPRRRGDGLRGFFWPRTHYASDDEAAEFAQRIRGSLESAE